MCLFSFYTRFPYTHLNKISGVNTPKEKNNLGSAYAVLVNSAAVISPLAAPEGHLDNIVEILEDIYFRRKIFENFGNIIVLSLNRGKQRSKSMPI